MRSLARVAAALLVLLPLHAVAADEPEPISPDRASASVSVATVGRGVIQIETGLAYGYESIAASSAARRFAVEGTLRIGLADNLDLRLDFDPIVRLRGPVDDTDHGDFVVAFKYRFLDPADDGWWPALGVLPFVRLPVTEPPIGSGKTDFGLVLIASFALPGGAALDFDAGVVAAGQSAPSGYLLQALLAAGLSRDVTESFGLFTDLLYSTRDVRGGRDSLQLDAGVLWRPTRDIALDASVVTSLAGSGPDWALRGGVSVRFGR